MNEPIISLGNHCLEFVETEFLKPVATAIILPAEEAPISLKEVYQTGSGLDVDETFLTYVNLDMPQTADASAARSYVALLMKEDTLGSSAIWATLSELSAKHRSRPDDMAILTLRQLGRQSGFLSTDGSANVFYVNGKPTKDTPSPVVDIEVYWNHQDPRCHIYRWASVADFWEAGTRIICPGTAKL